MWMWILEKIKSVDNWLQKSIVGDERQPLPKDEFPKIIDEDEHDPYSRYNSGGPSFEIGEENNDSDGGDGGE